MCYRLPFILLFCVLSAFAAHASTVAIPNPFVKNFSVDDYKASCQNWGLSVTPDGILYVANNSGLLTFDGNTWNVYELPDQSIITGVTYQNDTIYTRSETSLGGWTRDKEGLLQYHSLTEFPPGINFEIPPIHIPFKIPKEIQAAEPSALNIAGDLFLIGTQLNGLYIMNAEGDILQHLTLQNQLPDNIVRAICVQDPQQIWVAFDNGLSQISFEPPITLLGKRSVTGKLTNASLHEDDIYIQTNTGYFKRSILGDNQFLPVEEEEALLYLSIDSAENQLTVDQLFTNKEALGVFAKAERIYPAMENLYWLSLKNEAGLFHRENGTGTLKCRLLFDNYNMNVVTRGKRIIPLNDSLHLVSAMQGIILVNIRGLIGSSLTSSAPLQVSSIEFTDANGIHRLPTHTQELSLPHDFQELTIHVGTTIFTPNHQISYMIEGVSSSWSPWQKGGEISFLQLPEGKYNLLIRKYIIKGPFPELSLTVDVRPPWYNTIWAWLIYIALVWFVGQNMLRYNLKNLHKEEENKLEAERQAELQRMQQLKSEMLEAELQNKNNELTLQTTALVKRNQAVQTLLKELEQQKEALGERYPNKFYTKMRSLMEETLNDQEDWLLFESYFNSTHQNFIERLRQQYSEITVGDLRICCLLRMNLTTKEIASLLNVSVRAIELRRYRLRKRLLLEGDANLVDFLLSY